MGFLKKLGEQMSGKAPDKKFSFGKSEVKSASKKKRALMPRMK